MERSGDFFFFFLRNPKVLYQFMSESTTRLADGEIMHPKILWTAK